MKYTPKTLLRVIALALYILAQSLHAQPTPAQLEHIASLVESGKLDEAKIRTETLLEVYPGDPQLEQMSTLLKQHNTIAPKKSPERSALDRIRSSLSDAPTKVSPTPESTPITPAELSGMDQLEIQTVQVGAEQALRTGESKERDRLLRSLLDRPVPEAARNSTAYEWLPYWQSRAVAALTLDDYQAGWQSGQALIRLNALSTKDSVLSQVMANLNLKGWLKNSVAEVTHAKTARYEPWLGMWNGKNSYTKNETHPRAGTANLPYTGWISLKIELSEALKPMISFEGTLEYYHGYSEYLGNDLFGWRFTKYLFKGKIPGSRTSEWWMSPKGENYQQASATYGGMTQAGTYELTQFEFSTDMKELTLWYQITATDKSIQDGKILFRMEDSGKRLNLSANPFFTEVKIENLTR